MNKLAIPALVSACIFFLAFDALGISAYVELDYYDHDGSVDQAYGPITISGNGPATGLSSWTALDVLYAAVMPTPGMSYHNESWGVYVTSIGGVTPQWYPNEEWWMATVRQSGGCPDWMDVDLRNYTVQDGDTIGMWNVTGYWEEWPYSCD